MMRSRMVLPLACLLVVGIALWSQCRSASETQTPAAVPDAAVSPSSDPLSLNDCVVLQLLPTRGEGYSGMGSGRKFTNDQRAALARILGRVNYERYEYIPYDNIPPGLVAGIIVPSQAASLTFSFPDPWYRPYQPRVRIGQPRPSSEDTKDPGPETFRIPIWGFFPDIASGQLPQTPGEAVVLASGGGGTPPIGPKSEDIGTEAAPRTLGTHFRPVCYRELKSDFTVVGLTDAKRLWQETIWLSAFPPEPESARGSGGPWEQRSSERASAIIQDVAGYERLLDQVIETGVRWRAVRLRQGAVDPSWGHDGWDYPVPHVRAHLWHTDTMPNDLSLDLMVRVTSNDHSNEEHRFPLTELEPVPLAELEFIYDGRSLKMSWTDGGRRPVSDRLEREEG